MIIECPSCATTYEVPETAIGPDGRKVRCHKCGFHWHETGVAAQPEEAAPDDAGEPFLQDDPAPASEPPQTGGPAPATDFPSAAGSEAAEAFEAAEAEGTSGHSSDAPGNRLAPEPDEPVGDAADMDGDSSPGSGAAIAGRRGWWIWAAVVLLLMIAAAFLAVRTWGMPAWLPGGNEATATWQPDLRHDFPENQQGFRQLANGTEIYSASGTITNVGDTTRQVPPLLIVLRDGRDRIVYSLEVVPPKRRLEPGESVAINEAVTDVPRSARVADIDWKPG